MLAGIPKNVKSLGVCLHNPVLDSIVDHLHEMPGTGRTAVNITLFRCASQLLPSGCTCNVATTGSKSFENWIELLDHFFWPADHHAVAALQAPNAPAGADVNIMNSLFAEHLRTTNVVFEIRVTAVYENVAGFHFLRNRLRGRFGGAARGNHEPRDTRRAELRAEVFERSRSNCAFGCHP